VYLSARPELPVQDSPQSELPSYSNFVSEKIRQLCSLQRDQAVGYEYNPTANIKISRVLKSFKTLCSNDRASLISK